MRIFAMLLMVISIGCNENRRQSPSVAASVSPASTAKQFDQDRALEILAESTKLLALMQSNRAHGPQSQSVETHRFDVIHNIWKIAIFENTIDDLGGPKAIDVAYLLLHELDCNTEDNIPQYYVIVRDEFKIVGDTHPQEEIREFLQRALAKRTEPELISLE